MTDEVVQAARTMWQWLPVQDKPAKADMIFVFGNKSDALPGKAAELYNQGFAPLIVLSGGYGRLTKNDKTTEADRYMTALSAIGIPKSAIIMERQSTNTGENIEFTKKLVADKGLNFKKALAVTTGMLSRRHRASLHKLWPDIDWLVCTPPPKQFDKRMAEDNVDEFFNLMVGEINRLEHYPQQGFLETVTIPVQVHKAQDILVRAGYTKYLVAG